MCACAPCRPPPRMPCTVGRGDGKLAAVALRFPSHATLAARPLPQAVEALRRMRWEVTTPAGFEGLRVTPELRAVVEQVRPCFRFHPLTRLLCSQSRQGCKTCSGAMGGLLRLPPASLAGACPCLPATLSQWGAGVILHP